MSSKQALLVATVEASTGWSCYHNLYTGNDEHFCVYSYYAGVEKYDNKGIYEMLQITLHVVAPHGENLILMLRKLKKDLQAAGFTYPTEMSAGDELAQDVILETSIWDAIPYTEETTSNETGS